MKKNKERAIGILIVLGSLLLLVATWNLPETSQHIDEVN
jgi:hypothetical protein